MVETTRTIRCGHPQAEPCCHPQFSRAAPRRFIRRVKKSGWASMPVRSCPRPLPVHPAASPCGGKKSLGRRSAPIARQTCRQADLFTCRSRRQGPHRTRAVGSSPKLIHLPPKAAGAKMRVTARAALAGLFPWGRRRWSIPLRLATDRSAGIGLPAVRAVLPWAAGSPLKEWHGHPRQGPRGLARGIVRKTATPTAGTTVVHMGETPMPRWAASSMGC